MKAKRYLAAVMLIILELVWSSTVQAEKLVIVTMSGVVYTVGETDLSGTALISSHDYGKSIYTAAGNYATGDIVLGFDDGTAAAVKYDALGTILSSGSIGDGSSLLGAAIRSNGELYFSNLTGWLYARSINDVTAAPAGYTLPANLQFMSGSSPYLSVVTTPQDEVIAIATDRKETWIRQGNDMSSVPAGYVNDHIVWDLPVTAWATLANGDIVLASGFSYDAKVFIRNKADMAALPTGYTGSSTHIDGVKFGSGARIKALARSSSDIVVIGNDAAQIYLRHAYDLSSRPYTNSYISGFPYGPCALAVTANNYVVIGFYDGSVLIRAIADFAGADISGPADFTPGGVVSIVAIIPMPDPTGGPTCDQVIAQGNVITGDFNKDCYVNLEDVAIFASGWAKCNEPNDVNCIW